MGGNVNAELGQIRAARTSLGKFRLKLLDPSLAALERGSADLRLAVEYLEQLEPVLRSRGARPPALDQALRFEITGLRRDFQQVSALLEGAGQFYQGWSRLLGCATEEEAANYTAHARPAAVHSIDSKGVVIHG
jgi:hypothetical protein